MRIIFSVKEIECHYFSITCIMGNNYNRLQFTVIGGC